MKTIFTVLLLMMSTVLFAGEKGNGGDAVVCRNTRGEITSAELLDYYEGRILRGFSVRDSAALSDEEFINENLGRISRLDGDFMFTIDDGIDLLKKIRTFLETTETNARIGNVIFTSETLRDINDSGELILKENCKVEQLAIRLDNEFDEDPEFIIQASILRTLGDRDLRGLVLHEILYREIDRKAANYAYETSDSIGTRYLHQKLLSKESAEAFSFRDYMKVLSYLCNKTCKNGNWTYAVSGNLSGVFMPSISGILKDGVDLTPLSSTVRYTFDRNGETSMELNLKHGSVEILPYAEVYYPGASGRVILTNGKVSFNRRIFDGFIAPTVLAYGKWKMTVILDATNGAPEKNNLGFAFKNGFRDINVSAEVRPGQTVIREFELSLNDQYLPEVH